MKTETETQSNRSARPRQGLVIVNTGDGKGKTTAALGVVLRSWGRGLRICVIQFLKAATASPGEVKAAKKMGLEWHKAGDGFTWTSRDMDETIACALHGWELAQEKIASGNYDLVVLDEFTYLLHFGWLRTDDALDWLRANKPQDLHLLITGRSAPPELVNYADLVTEMKMVKHPFEKGLKAQPGIEF
jgi:cob(I)alamin adenosyltransferase